MEDIDVKSDIQLFITANRQETHPEELFKFVPYQGSHPGFQEYLEGNVTRQYPGEESGLAGIFSKLTDRLFPEAQAEKMQAALDIIIEKAWEGEELTVEDEHVFDTIVRERPGRKVWASCMNQRRLIGRFAIAHDGFPHVVEQMRTVLNECEKSQDSNIGKLCIIIAQTFFRELPSGENEFLQSSIVSHPLWQNLDFWDRTIQQTIEEELKTGKAGTGLESDNERVKNAVFCQLGTFANYLIAFSVDQMFAGELISKLACKYDLPNEDIATLMGIVDKDLPAPEIPGDVKRGVPRWLEELEGHVPENMKARGISEAVGQPQADDDAEVSSPSSEKDRISDVKEHVPRGSSVPLEEILKKGLPRQSGEGDEEGKQDSQKSE